MRLLFVCAAFALCAMHVRAQEFNLDGLRLCMNYDELWREIESGSWRINPENGRDSGEHGDNFRLEYIGTALPALKSAEVSVQNGRVENIRFYHWLDGDSGLSRAERWRSFIDLTRSLARAIRRTCPEATGSDSIVDVGLDSIARIRESWCNRSAEWRCGDTRFTVGICARWTQDTMRTRMFTDMELSLDIPRKYREAKLPDITTIPFKQCTASGQALPLELDGLALGMRYRELWKVIAEGPWEYDPESREDDSGTKRWSYTLKYTGGRISALSAADIFMERNRISSIWLYTRTAPHSGLSPEQEWRQLIDSSRSLLRSVQSRLLPITILDTAFDQYLFGALPGRSSPGSNCRMGNQGIYVGLDAFMIPGCDSISYTCTGRIDLYIVKPVRRQGPYRRLKDEWEEE